MRKLVSISVALFVVAGVMTAVPASAATISNGVKCTKLNQTTTVSGRKYKCAKNPMITNAKMTWLSNDCLIAANNFVKARRDSTAISTKYAEQIPVIDLGIANETANKAEIQLKLDESNLRLEAAKVKLAAAKGDAEKKILATAVSSWTSAVRAYTSKMNSIISSIRNLESAKTVALSQPARLATGITSSKETAQLICTKGL
ncbi:MAG: hypothetical protein HW379_1010 [Actinobacteria bacterium]|jgi:hypothetical protein|nr:hypothetical protein [Actinomycetota bacterium]